MIFITLLSLQCLASPFPFFLNFRFLHQYERQEVQTKNFHHITSFIHATPLGR